MAMGVVSPCLAHSAGVCALIAATAPYAQPTRCYLGDAAPNTLPPYMGRTPGSRSFRAVPSTLRARRALSLSAARTAAAEPTQLLGVTFVVGQK
ncbi:hypothetical protein RB195_004905 [Necator americanus]|uniref:Secreted protein n=1 Tax=Necator americanus TaxID=51031 RepID=A0ABR1BP60_NECAM